MRAQGARPEVEAGGPHDDVELAYPVRRLYPGRGDAEDGRLAQVDQGDVGTVERFEVAVHERWPLLPEPVVLRDEVLGRHRVLARWPRIFPAMNAHHSALTSGFESRSR